LKALELYIADLKSTIHEKRKRAINALISLKEKDAIKPLMVIANDRNIEIRYMVAKAFGVLEDKILIDTLIKYLGDESPKVRYRAAMSLMNYKHEKAVQPLINSLNDPDENVRYWVSKALAKSASEYGISKLIACLSSPEWIVRKTASHSIVEIGKPALPGLFETLKTAGEDACFWAIKTLGKISDQAATPHILPYLADRNPDIQIAALGALGNISDARAVAPLMALLETREGHLRPHLKEALCRIGDRCLPQLINALASSDWNARRLAASVLGEIGGRSIELLMSELKTTNDDQLYWIIEALGMLGDKVVTLSLVDLLKHPKTEIRVAVIKALGKIRDERSFEPLFSVMEESDDEIIQALVNTISGFGDAAVSALIKNLGSSKWQIRHNAAYCLMAIGPVIAPRMIELLDCKNRDVCYWASEIIVSFGKQLEDDMVELVESGNYDQRFYSSKILGRIKSEKSMSVLISALHDEYWSVRKNAAFSLGELKSVEALPALIKSLKDEDEDLRSEICIAISKMEITPAGKYLTPYIDDEFSTVRIAAINAVAKLGYSEAIAQISAHIADDNIQVRIAAIKAAGVLKAEACSNLLLKQMNMPELREHVISALGEIGAFSNIKYLIAVLAKSQDREERALSAKVLANYDQREVIKSLSEAISDEFYIVRKNAALSLTLINERRRMSEKSKDIGGSEAESLYSLGMSFMNAKKYSEAIVAFQRVLNIDPKNFNSIIKLGIAYENKDMMNEAIECFTKCISHSPNRPEGYIYLGVALGSAKRYEEALLNLKKAEQCAKNRNTLDIVQKLIKKIKSSMYSHYGS